MKFDADSYTITIRKENIDNEIYYVGRVAEIPTICAYEGTYEEAREIVLDAIQSFKQLADEEGSEFPEPFHNISHEYNGRITLRMTRSLHQKVSHLSALEGVSVNTFLVSAIAEYVGAKKQKSLVWNLSVSEKKQSETVWLSNIHLLTQIGSSPEIAISSNNLTKEPAEMLFNLSKELQLVSL